VAAAADAGSLKLGEGALVQADGSDLIVPGYAVPCFIDWNNDGLRDLIVGDGGNGFVGMVRVYLNEGVAGAPQFSGFTYVQADGDDLVVPGTECACGYCLGAFPRFLDWNADDKKDLILGTPTDGAWVYLNIGTDSAPTFDAGAEILYGPPGDKTGVGGGHDRIRTTLDLVDWDNDGLTDLVTGEIDGRVRVFVNEGTVGAPDFLDVMIVQDGAGDLVVPCDRSSPVVMDLNGDGNKDLLSGNTVGELLLYVNQGTDASPLFSGYEYVAANGVPIDLPDWPRSRPFVTDWNDDGLLDVLVGSGDYWLEGDGRIWLFLGNAPEPSGLVVLGLALLARRRKRRR